MTFLLAAALVLLAVSAVVSALLLNRLNRINYVAEPAPEAREPAGETAPTEAEAGELSGEDGLVDITGLEPREELTVPEGDVAEDDRVLNILLLGTDQPFSRTDPGRADAIMILSLDFRDASARLASLERGMGIPILSGRYKGQSDWLTHLYHYGGAELVMESVRSCFKVDLERYAQVDFAAFQGVIDALGGVDVELTDKEAWKLGLPAGPNHLDGQKALSFARLRSVDSDWVRVTRQRRVIQSCVNGLRDADLRTLYRVTDTVLPMISTNFTRKELLALLPRLLQFRGAELEQMTIPAPGTYGGITVMGGRGAYAPDFEKNARLLHEFLYRDK